jgi:hypothetical protein
VAGLEAMTAYFPYTTWGAGAIAAGVFVICIIASCSAGIRATMNFLVVAVVLTCLAGGGWLVMERLADHERMADRRALDQRSAGLTAQAIAPGSALACLDALAGDAVETACEKSVFAGPNAVAAAVSYTAARLSLLADASIYAERSEPAYETVLAPLRQALEADRFGLVAHVFAVRDSCTELQCDALALLRDPSRVQANLRERGFESYLARHAAEWPNKGGSVAAAAPAGPPPTQAGTPLSSRYDFPSAASIPPVSIMTSEPGATTAPPAQAPSAAPAQTSSSRPQAAPVPPRRPPQPPRAAATRPAGQALQISPAVAPPAPE